MVLSNITQLGYGNLNNYLRGRLDNAIPDLNFYYYSKCVK
ncbi:hypothetical protein BACCIP111883_03471 [Sutcliffiella rhizosphaerae]|uniref:Uncharacterized protein n=1 Tax=Sutcliffiella rhizosphaerae TaxID=2880967 RepID=A0ABN8ABU8_9BACI|nr:hypothetical protein BACCIP111883_03471 [Sutcliffiella rhizosphaerae]